MNKNMLEKRFSIGEVARLVGASEYHINQPRNTGKYPAMRNDKWNRRWMSLTAFFFSSNVVDFLLEHVPKIKEAFYEPAKDMVAIHR